MTAHWKEPKSLSVKMHLLFHPDLSKVLLEVTLVASADRVPRLQDASDAFVSDFLHSSAFRVVLLVEKEGRLVAKWAWSKLWDTTMKTSKSVESSLVIRSFRPWKNIGGVSPTRWCRPSEFSLDITCCPTYQRCDQWYQSYLLYSI